MPKPQDIFQLAQQEAVRVTASPQAWQSFLYTAAHNYHTTYLNQLLIHAQRPDAAACASMEYWNTKANRLVMRGSRSITVLQRRQGMAVTKPIFTIGDTTLLSQTRTGGPWEVTDTTRPLLLQGKPDDWLSALAQEGVSNEADRARRMLERNVADSTLQWAQPDEQMQLLQALVTQSAVYMALLRIGLPVRDEDFPAFQSASQFDTYQISLCLGGYVQAAAEPMLNAIGREALRLNRDSIAIPHEPVHNESTPTQLDSREEAVTHDVQQHEALVQTQTEQALSYIEDYLKDEFEITEPDFSDLTRIDLGYTTTEDEKHVIQVYADLEHCTVTKLVDDTLYAQERYGSLDDLNQAVLSNLDFDSLMEIDLDEAEEHEPQENALPTDESAAHDPTNYLAPYEPEVPTGAKAKFAANLNAIRTLKQIEQRGTPATEAEHDVLAGYLGWGGLADAFDPNKDSWHSEYEQLKDLLTPEEYAAAQESTLTAFYTPPAAIHAMYRALTRMGCVGGNVLEPTAEGQYTYWTVTFQ